MENKSFFEKYIKFFIAGAVILVLAVVGIGVGTYISGKSYDTYEPGNTHSNIAAGGIVLTTEDGTVYFVADSKLYRKDSEDECTQLTEYDVTSLVAHGDYLYYINYTDARRPYRMNVNTGEDECITEISSGNTSLNIVDNSLYFASLYGTNNEETGIYKLDIAAYEESKANNEAYTPEHVNLDWIKQMLYYDGRLYFINDRDFGKLYSIDINNPDERAVSVGRATTCFTFYEGWMYYSNVYGVYKCRPDGTRRQQLSDKRASIIHVADGYVYHCLKGGGADEANQELYRTKLDKPMTSTEIITKDAADRMGYAEDYLYFENLYKSFTLYRVSNDNKVFENVEAKFHID